MSRRRQPRRARLRFGVGRLLVLISLTVVVTALGLYQVHSRYEVVQVGYTIHQDLVEHRRLLEANKRLRLTLSAYKDPMAVRAFAEDALEMHPPGSQDELVIPAPDAPAPPASRFGGLLPQAGAQ
ncbi:MAG: hypothetical protein CSA66_05850 [Proteobacteria bacterium]|nr:MAG: hypothetical protein CSA66_05850 [Pseudomonadota bacterium]